MAGLRIFVAACALVFCVGSAQASMLRPFAFSGNAIVHVEDLEDTGLVDGSFNVDPATGLVSDFSINVSSNLGFFGIADGTGQVFGNSLGAQPFGGGPAYAYLNVPTASNNLTDFLIADFTGNFGVTIFPFYGTMAGTISTVPSPVPLPPALLLFLTMLAGIGGLRWWRRKVV